MSLQSDFELSKDVVFQGKVRQAVAKALLDLAVNGSDEEKDFAKGALRNVHWVAEQAAPLICAIDSVDSSSSDKTIEAAARQVIKAAS